MTTVAGCVQGVTIAGFSFGADTRGWVHGYILYINIMGTYACHWIRPLRWRRPCSSTNIETWLHRPITGCCTANRGREFSAWSTRTHKCYYYHECWIIVFYEIYNIQTGHALTHCVKTCYVYVVLIKKKKIPIYLITLGNIFISW